MWVRVPPSVPKQSWLYASFIFFSKQRICYIIYFECYIIFLKFQFRGIRQLPRRKRRSLKGGSFQLGLTRESGLRPAPLDIGNKTHPGMLPQSRALERAEADNREGKGETVRTRGRDPLKPVSNIPEGRRFARSALRP